MRFDVYPQAENDVMAFFDYQSFRSLDNAIAAARPMLATVEIIPHVDDTFRQGSEAAARVEAEGVRLRVLHYGEDKDTSDWVWDDPPLSIIN